MGWDNVKSFCKDNSCTIFTVLAVICSVGTAISTTVATVKSCKEIENAEYDKWEDMGEPESPDVDISLTKAETVKLVWPHYILPAVLLFGGVTCEICALKAGQRKVEALTGAYVMAAQTVSALRDSVHHNLPPRDARLVETGAVHNMIEADKTNPDTAKRIIALQNEGETTTVYRDAYSPKGSGIYFKGSMDKFRKAVNLYNKLLSDRSKDGLKGTINDWYDCLGLCGISVGNSDLGDVLEFSWDDDGPMQLYAVCDRVDVDFDDNAIIAIGLRRADEAEGSLAIPSTPHGYKSSYRLN